MLRKNFDSVNLVLAIVVLVYLCIWAPLALGAQSTCTTQPDGSVLCCEPQRDGTELCTSSLQSTPVPTHTATPTVAPTPTYVILPLPVCVASNVFSCVYLPIVTR